MMSNLYAVDNCFMFQFKQRYFLFLVNQEGCQAATEICSQISGMRMVYRETFLQIHKRLIRQLIQECSIQGISLLREIIPVQASAEKPATESGDRDHNQS